ncbi:unnamed protein product [Protopolystoma xenopodis]|uniref:Uncharacterized protein n=1 Tax=Protopolystoma xenopodis TaxID=117903 RepID=A0A3S5CKR2_9PLAT|nr:unnamed protein product [Protopolystoma xenopodis]
MQYAGKWFVDASQTSNCMFQPHESDKTLTQAQIKPVTTNGSECFWLKPQIWKDPCSTIQTNFAWFGWPYSFASSVSTVAANELKDENTRKRDEPKENG